VNWISRVIPRLPLTVRKRRPPFRQAGLLRNNELHIGKLNIMKTNSAGLKQVCGLLPGIALIAAVLILAACGEKPQPSQPPAPQAAPAKLFQQDREALDKAKGVEQTEAKSAEDLKREEEKQTK
jgi:hypothetical protein